MNSLTEYKIKRIELADIELKKILQPAFASKIY